LIAVLRLKLHHGLSMHAHHVFAKELNDIEREMECQIINVIMRSPGMAWVVVRGDVVPDEDTDEIVQRMRYRNA